MRCLLRYLRKRPHEGLCGNTLHADAAYSLSSVRSIFPSTRSILPSFCVLVLAALAGARSTHAQPQLEYLGLQDHDVTSLGVYSGIVTAGTIDHGVFWQSEMNLPDEGWNLIGLEDHEACSVYPHKSGPVGWAIGAGVQPADGDTVFFYCSFMGQEFEACSDGISADLTWAITDLDGFPDPSVCGETYAAGGRALYRRAFGSPDWELIYLVSIEGNVYSVQAHENAPGVVLAGGGEGFAGMYFLIKSLDYGDNWYDISPPGFIFDVDFVGDQADTIFVAVGSGVHRSFDGGGSWDQVFTAQLPNGDYISEVIIEPERQRVYIGGTSWWYEAPLFFSDDWGENWHRIATGMLGEIVSLQIGSERALLFAHRTEGVFRLDPDLVGVANMPVARATVYQNHPNPFNPATFIGFDLPRAEAVRLAVYSLDGHLVATVINETLSAGRHEAIWAGQDDAGRQVATGNYIYRLQAGTFSEAKRMLLLR